MKNIFILMSLVVIYLFFRLYNHVERVNFAEDQGIILQDTFDMWHEMKPKLIGPKVSHGFEGRFFFHGPYVYYFLLPGMIIANWNPIGGSLATIFWNMLGIFFLYFIGVRVKSKLLGILLALLYASNPFIINYTTFVWNPNFLPFISTILAFLLLDQKKSRIGRNALLLGFLVGVGLLFHYQMVLIIPFCIAYFIYHQDLSIKNILYFLFAFLLGVLPLFIFELKHDFYNLKTIYFILLHGGVTSEGLPLFYFMVPIIILLILGFVLLYMKVSQRNKRYILFLLSLIVCINVVLGFRNMNAKLNQLSYTEIHSAAKIIIDKKLENYNVANLTTGNTRAHPLRYVLYSNGYIPLGVEEYPQAINLFVISVQKDTAEIEKYPVWELSSFDGQVVEKWQLGLESDYYLYWLQKKELH